MHECNCKGISIYATPQWAATVRTAEAKPYIVEELDSNDFLEFKTLSQVIPNFDYDTDGLKIRWMKIKTISATDDDFNIVKIQYSDLSYATLNLGVCHRNTRAARGQNDNAFTIPSV